MLSLKMTPADWENYWREMRARNHRARVTSVYGNFKVQFNPKDSMSGLETVTRPVAFPAERPVMSAMGDYPED